MKSKDFCLQIHFRTSFVLKFNVSIEKKKLYLSLSEEISWKSLKQREKQDKAKQK